MISVMIVKVVSWMVIVPMLNYIDEFYSNKCYHMITDWLPGRDL
jgi:hypothetical protein